MQQGQRPTNAQIAALLGLDRAGPGPSMGPVNVSFPTPRFVPTGSLKPTPKSISGSIQATIANGLNRLGMNERRSNRLATRTMAPLTDVTPVGNAVGAQEGGRQFMSGVSRGDLRAMALGAGVFGLSVAPMPGGAKRAAKKLGTGLFGSMAKDTSGAIRAWHGSPHDFDRFDISKIGTGEGTAFEGRGLYFTDSEDWARRYRNALSVNPSTGRVYKVDINANPEDFFDLRTPLISQPANIQSIARSADLSHLKPGNRTRRQLEMFRTGDDVGYATGQQLLDALEDYGMSNTGQFSAGLKEMGYSGTVSNIRGGSRNYVVFDDSLIDILNKY